MKSLLFALLFILPSAVSATDLDSVPPDHDKSWFVHHLAAEDFSQTPSDPGCEGVEDFANENYRKPAEALGLKTFIWIRTLERCGLRVLFYPQTKEQLAGYH